MSVISASLSPNTQIDDVTLALRVLLTPWTWKRGAAVSEVETWFCNYLQTPAAVRFNSGRSALLAILKSFAIGNGHEVIMQAFTCVAVPNSVLWAGATPVFADIDDTYNINPSDIEKKITPKTKAIIVQHTFGVPAQMDAITALAKRYKLILIEDCAHSLGAVSKRKKVGTFGDAAFFSFGRDKILSSVWGGMATMSSKFKVESSKLKEYQKKLPMPGYFWILQQLLHPVAFALILPTYNIGVGKLALVLLQKLRLLSFPVYSEEKRGGKPSDFPAQYPNALAMLLLNQLKKLETYNKQRRNIAKFYGKTIPGAVYLRYPMDVPSPDALRKKARKKGILLGNWYHNVIDPTGVDLAKVGYKKGSCPKAEAAAAHMINLPTLIGASQAETVKSILRYT
jgi:dTDP-4-amino-4,6-dideoxygalactose transaminase